MIIVYFWKIIIERKLVKKDLDTKNELPIVLQKNFFLRFEIKIDLIFVKLRRKKFHNMVFVSAKLAADFDLWCCEISWRILNASIW